MIGYDEALKIAQDYAEKTGRTLRDATEGKKAWYFGNTFESWLAEFGNGPIAVDKRTGKTDVMVISVLMNDNTEGSRETLDTLLHKDADIVF